jgi:uncharacterized membrane protein YkgB
MKCTKICPRFQLEDFMRVDREAMTGQRMLGDQFNEIDQRITRWMARTGLVLLRISIGIVFFWFGALKLVPGASPAGPLIAASWGFLPYRPFMVFLGLWEMAIGLGFISGQFLRITILLMMLQMAGTVSPIVLVPDAVWQQFPFVLTLEGQYIIKNLVLIGAALVVGSTVRGGGINTEGDSP